MDTSELNRFIESADREIRKTLDEVKTAFSPGQLSSVNDLSFVQSSLDRSTGALKELARKIEAAAPTHESLEKEKNRITREQVEDRRALQELKATVEGQKDEISKMLEEDKKERKTAFDGLLEAVKAEIGKIPKQAAPAQPAAQPAAKPVAQVDVSQLAIEIATNSQFSGNVAKILGQSTTFASNIADKFSQQSLETIGRNMPVNSTELGQGIGSAFGQEELTYIGSHIDASKIQVDAGQITVDASKITVDAGNVPVDAGAIATSLMTPTSGSPTLAGEIVTGLTGSLTPAAIVAALNVLPGSAASSFAERVARGIDPALIQVDAQAVANALLDVRTGPGGASAFVEGVATRIMRAVTAAEIVKHLNSGPTPFGTVVGQAINTAEIKVSMSVPGLANAVVDRLCPQNPVPTAALPPLQLALNAVLSTIFDTTRFNDLATGISNGLANYRHQNSTVTFVQDLANELVLVAGTTLNTWPTQPQQQTAMDYYIDRSADLIAQRFMTTQLAPNNETLPTIINNQVRNVFAPRALAQELLSPVPNTPSFVKQLAEEIRRYRHGNQSMSLAQELYDEMMNRLSLNNSMPGMPRVTLVTRLVHDFVAGVVRDLPNAILSTVGGPNNTTLASDIARQVNSVIAPNLPADVANIILTTNLAAPGALYTDTFVDRIGTRVSQGLAQTFTTHRWGDTDKTLPGALAEQFLTQNFLSKIFETFAYGTVSTETESFDFFQYMANLILQSIPERLVKDVVRFFLSAKVYDGDRNGQGVNLGDYLVLKLKPALQPRRRRLGDSGASNNDGSDDDDESDGDTGGDKGSGKAGGLLARFSKTADTPSRKSKSDKGKKDKPPAAKGGRDAGEESSKAATARQSLETITENPHSPDQSQRQIGAAAQADPQRSTDSPTPNPYQFAAGEPPAFGASRPVETPLPYHNPPGGQFQTPSQDQQASHSATGSLTRKRRMTTTATPPSTQRESKLRKTISQISMRGKRPDGLRSRPSKVDPEATDNVAFVYRQVEIDVGPATGKKSDKDKLPASLSGASREALAASTMEFRQKTKEDDKACFMSWYLKDRKNIKESSWDGIPEGHPCRSCFNYDRQCFDFVDEQCTLIRMSYASHVEGSHDSEAIIDQAGGRVTRFTSTTPMDVAASARPSASIVEGGRPSSEVFN